MSSETTIYWYPLGTGSLETITIPFVTDVSDTDVEAVSATAETTAGGMFRQHYGAWRRLILLRQRLRYTHTDEEIAIRGLYSLQDHLVKGHSVGIAVGANKAWGAFTGPYPRGTTAILVPASAYGSWSSSSMPVAGDELVVQSVEPEGTRELHKVQSVTPFGSMHTITFTRGLRYDHAGPVFVRHRRFYPHLKMPEDQIETEILTSANRHITEDLRLELREDNQELWTFGLADQQLPAADSTGWDRTPEEIQADALGLRNLRPI